MTTQVTINPHNFGGSVVLLYKISDKRAREMTIPEFIRAYFFATDFVANTLARYDGDEDDVNEITTLIATLRHRDQNIEPYLATIDAWLARYAMRKVVRHRVGRLADSVDASEFHE